MFSVFMVWIIKCLFRFVVCFMQYEINVDIYMHALAHTHTLHTQTQSMLANMANTHTLSLSLVRRGLLGSRL